MKILITGGAGFIGSYLSNKLAHKHEVHIIDNAIRGDYSRLDDEVQIHKTDLLDINELKRLPRDFDWIFHLAAINGTGNFYSNHHKVFEVGVKSILNIYDYFKECNIKLVTSSSAEVYQSAKEVPTNEEAECIIPDITNKRYSYGGSKIFSELLILNYGITYFEKSIIFRPHNIYGPNMGYKHVIPQLIEKIQYSILSGKKKVQLIGDGLETRAFCFIDDLLEGLLLLMESGIDKNIYHIGNNEEVSILNLTRKIIDIIGVDIEIIIGENIHAGSTRRRCPDISKMKKIGYNPKINLDLGLEKTIEWYLNNPNKHKNKLI